MTERAEVGARVCDSPYSGVPPGPSWTEQTADRVVSDSFWARAGRCLRAQLVAGCLLLGAWLATVRSAQAAQRPNVLIFVVDDMGYGDSKAYNPASKAPMPNTVRLARAGMMFTDAHTTGAVCAPTRYSILSGNYPWRGRRPAGTWRFNLGSQFLAGQKCLAEVMAEGGYHTAMFGKTHLGLWVPPKKAGAEPDTSWDAPWEAMDFSRPMRGGMHDKGFAYTYLCYGGVQRRPFAFFENDRLDGDPADLKDWKKGKYGHSVLRVDGFGMPDWDTSKVGPILTEKALAFIDAHHDANKRSSTKRPFFIHYCSQAVHVPHTPPDYFLDPAVPVRGVAGTRHMDMLHEVDLQLGALLDALEQRGLLKDTLVILTSDNGGLRSSRRKKHDSMGGLRGKKGDAWEGGHRVPFIVRWGDGTAAGSVVAPGSRTEQLIGLQDIYATLAELIERPQGADQGLDSASFLNVLRGKQTTPVREQLLVQTTDYIDRVHVPGDTVVREGTWKLILEDDGTPLELYDLAKDLAEKKNLIKVARHAARIKRMKAKHDEIKASTRSTPAMRRP